MNIYNNSTVCSPVDLIVFIILLSFLLFDFFNNCGRVDIEVVLLYYFFSLSIIINFLLFPE